MPGLGTRIANWFGLQLPATPRARARNKAIWRGSVAGVALIVVGSVAKLPLLVLSPGPTYNTIGEVGGTPLIKITGTTTYPTDGSLDLTTVSERGGTSGGVPLGEALFGWFAPGSSVLPREAFYRPNDDLAEINERNDQLFALSQSDAIGAAMNLLGIETTQRVVVTTVGGGTPADGIVRAGDEVVKVNGKRISSPSAVGKIVRSGQVGDTVDLEVIRDGETGTVALEVVAGSNPEVAGKSNDLPSPYLGIMVGTTHEAPFPIDFSLDHVGGPSAGMMFSLGIVDMLTPGSLTGGGHVAGTGTIEPDGHVGPIGGIGQKLRGAKRAGATLFLAPNENCDEVVGAEPPGVVVVPVKTLKEARATLQDWAKNPTKDFKTCAASIAESK